MEYYTNIKTGFAMKIDENGNYDILIRSSIKDKTFTGNVHNLSMLDEVVLDGLMHDYFDLRTKNGKSVYVALLNAEEEDEKVLDEKFEELFNHEQIDIDCNNLEWDDKDNKLSLIVPFPHNYKEFDLFFEHVWEALTDMGFELNGLLDGSELLIKDDDIIYNGAFVTNACYWNAFKELFETGKTALHQVEKEDIEDSINEWFNDD